MRIKNIAAIKLEEAGPPQDWRDWFGQILVAVETDEELTGYGVGAGGQAGILVVQTALRDVLIGKEITDVPSLFDMMYDKTSAYVRKGLQ